MQFYTTVIKFHRKLISTFANDTVDYKGYVKKKNFKQLSSEISNLRYSPFFLSFLFTGPPAVLLNLLLRNYV